MVFATYIAGQTQFPEFTLVLMLDDVEVMYYDSILLKAVHRSQSNSSDDNGGGSIFSDIYDIMKDRTFYLKDHQNCTDGKCNPINFGIQKFNIKRFVYAFLGGILSFLAT